MHALYLLIAVVLGVVLMGGGLGAWASHGFALPKRTTPDDGPPPRVLFVLKHRTTPYGGSGQSWGEVVGRGGVLSSGLFNSARMVATMLWFRGIRAKVVHVQDNNCIHGEAVKFGATVVIIEAFWVVPEKFKELRKALPGVQFIVRNHSETPFLASEGMAFDWTLRYAALPNVAISCNSPRMLRETRLLIQARYPHWSPAMVAAKVPYLPNYYDFDRATSAPPWDDDEHTLHVGCFGAVRPLKNHMMQAVAAIELAESLGRPLRFHVNAGRVEMNGSPILKNLQQLFSAYKGRHQLVEQPWRPHAQFRELVRNMDIVTQVSFSETFNIVAADAVSQGVPTVTSKEISWSSRLFRADPTCSRSIARAMRRAYTAKRWFSWFNPSLAGLRAYNDRSAMIWLRQLRGS